MRHENLSPDTPELPSPAVTSNTQYICLSVEDLPLHWTSLCTGACQEKQGRIHRAHQWFALSVIAGLSFLSRVLLWSMKKLNAPFFAILCCMINGGCERNAPALARDSETYVWPNQLNETEAHAASHNETKMFHPSHSLGNLFLLRRASFVSLLLWLAGLCDIWIYRITVTTLIKVNNQVWLLHFQHQDAEESWCWLHQPTIRLTDNDNLYSCSLFCFSIHTGQTCELVNFWMSLLWSTFRHWGC